MPKPKPNGHVTGANVTGANAASGAGDARSHPASASIEALDPLLQHRSRLGAMVLLSTSPELPFSRLRDLLGETDGNLGAQLRKLEEAGYLKATKAFIERKPVTTYSITKSGHAQLKAHLDAMAKLIRTANGEVA